MSRAMDEMGERERRLEAAARWYSALRDPDIAHETWQDFNAWEADPENASAFRDVESALGLVDASLRQIPGPMTKARRPDGSGRRIRSLAAALAAMAALLALLAAIIIAPGLGGEKDAQSFQTGLGERQDVRLADGTHMILNTGTKLDVVYSSRRRLVRLRTGQAYFDVTKDGRPFLVETGSSRTEALGTRFDVFNENGTTRVTLLAGTVRVDTFALDRRKAGLLPRSRKPATSRRLEPGEQVSMNQAGNMTMKSVDPGIAESWHSGVLLFDDEPLVEVIAELNRYAATRLVIADPRLEDLRLSGAFQAGAQEEFAANLKYVLPVRTERSGEDILVLPARESTP